MNIQILRTSGERLFILWRYDNSIFRNQSEGEDRIVRCEAELDEVHWSMVDDSDDMAEVWYARRHAVWALEAI